ncbi:MAG: hypothetical protein GY874_16585 [Desulfobacteraceae bacterium]|nr:hypothetical protein [Desulfobacteraceae bacterium]
MIFFAAADPALVALQTRTALVLPAHVTRLAHRLAGNLVLTAVLRQAAHYA